MAKIIMLSHFKLDPNGLNFGPGIRIWEIAKALTKKGHNITICQNAYGAKEDIIENIKLIKFDLEALNKIKEYDVAYAQNWLNDKEIFEKLDAIPIIIDAYAPYLLEHVYYPYEKKSSDSYLRFADDIVKAAEIPMVYGDYFLCANESQRKYYLGMLSVIGRITPENKGDIIGIVPYGARTFLNKNNKSVLKNKIPKNKKIILWLSSFYPWLDPLIAAKIMLELSKINNEFVLAVVGAKSPFVHNSLYEENLKKFVDFAKENLLYEENIFFFDWIDNESLDSVYKEASFLIVTSNPKTLETEFSFRVRIMDALSANLPVISTGGDFLSEQIEKNKMGLIIKDMNPKKAADELNKITKTKIESMKKNIQKFIKLYRWDNLIGPIDEFCRNPCKDEQKTKVINDLAKDYRRDLTIILRKNIYEKEGHIKNLENNLKDKENELEICKQNMTELKERNSHLKKIKEDLEIELTEKERKLAELKSHLGRIKASIVYPAFKITSAVGNTYIGKILQKLLK